MNNLFDNENESFCKKIREIINNSIKLDICVGYFNFNGWSLLSEYIENMLNRNGSVRLLVGINGIKDRDMEEFYHNFFDEKINLLKEAPALSSLLWSQLKLPKFNADKSKP
ncbi:MAG: hypothetical protein PT118_18230 [Aphanizomenon gracile PMC644.10]|nr:hypothetical protein [Aphanizomenon gracile PMC644.10]